MHPYTPVLARIIIDGKVFDERATIYNGPAALRVSDVEAHEIDLSKLITAPNGMKSNAGSEPWCPIGWSWTCPSL
jgi:hypothetical protein